MCHRVVVLAVLMSLALITSCSKSSDEEVIKKLIAKAARMAEEHDAGGLMDLTSRDFLVLPGETERRDVKRILLWAFRQYGELRVLYPRPSVELHPSGEGASATVTFLIVRKDQSLPNLKELYEDPEGWLMEVGDRADLYRLRLEMAKEGGDWLVTRARLETFTGLGFSE